MVEVVRTHGCRPRIRGVTMAAVVVAAALAAGCGSSEDTAGSATTTAVEVSSTTIEDRTDATVPGYSTWDVASLQSCDGLTDYSTPPNWLVEDPVGLVLDGASSEHSISEVPSDTPASTATEFLLAERGPDDRLVSTMVVVRDVGPAVGFYDSPVDDVVVDSVRRRPGTVARYTNRGDSEGTVTATWSEGGVEWAARTRTGTPQDLASALEPLELDGGVVSDPSGRFEVIGDSPVTVSAENRRTIIELGPDPGDAGAVAAVGIEIRPRAEGASGVTASNGLQDFPSGPEARIVEVDGRTVLTDPVRAMIALPDGSIASAKVQGRYEQVGQTLRPGWTRPDQEELRQIVLSIVAVSPDDPRLSAVPMPKLMSPSPMCSEAG